MTCYREWKFYVRFAEILLTECLMTGEDIGNKVSVAKLILSFAV
jgi:hypothetical protein